MDCMTSIEVSPARSPGRLPACRRRRMASQWRHLHSDNPLPCVAIMLLVLLPTLNVLRAGLGRAELCVEGEGAGVRAGHASCPRQLDSYSRNVCLTLITTHWRHSAAWLCNCIGAVQGIYSLHCHCIHDCTCAMCQYMYIHIRISVCYCGSLGRSTMTLLLLLLLFFLSILFSTSPYVQVFVFHSIDCVSNDNCL